MMDWTHNTDEILTAFRMTVGKLSLRRARIMQNVGGEAICYKGQDNAEC
jgi:hypothetical protein